MTSAVLASVATRLAQSQTTLAETRTSPADSVVVESPLPGGAATVARFLLNTVPQWVQIGGVIVAALLAVLVAVLIYRRRQRITTWVSAKSRPAKIGLGVAAALMLVAVAGAGAATWNYTQHSNAFCTGCHVMKPAFQRFTHTESGHNDLSCHDCHQQPVTASIRQLYLWVAERPEKIGMHTKLENAVCERCHVTGDTARWQRIAQTAGHRVHLESDSSTLRELKCVTCHGVEVHSFRPVEQTCGQSECHSPANTDIVLGKMADQTMRHCTSCHDFTADVPALATRDSAAGTLVPGLEQCTSCHAMAEVVPDFNAAKDPHGGKCGSCHNPHQQKAAREAALTCTTSGCHANWKDEPFHTGASHRRIATATDRCITCHIPHQAKVDASDCQACHQSVRAAGRLRPPVPFDTAAALRRSDPAPAAAPSRPPPSAHPVSSPHRVSTPRVDPWPVHRGGPFVPDPGDEETTVTAQYMTSEPADSDVRVSSPVQQDTFPHQRHTRIACLVCHQTGSGQGRLTFERPRGCAICHHQAPRQAKCETCHQTEEYGQPYPATVTVTVSGSAPRPRDVAFVHAQHTSRPCLECHTTPVTLAPTPSRGQCIDCHVEHHDVVRTCTACHVVAEPRIAHPTPEIAHQRCDACHTRTTVEQLTPTRSFCSTCHATLQTNHFPTRECTVCHFLAEPAAYRPRLTTTPRR